MAIKLLRAYRERAVELAAEAGALRERMARVTALEQEVAALRDVAARPEVAEALCR